MVLTICATIGTMQKHLSIIKDLVDKIEENVAEELNIIALAKTSKMSPWHFQRLFKTMIGDSLGGYVRGRRLSKAADFLISTELRIIDIAFDVGFKSQEAFARAFKTYFNYTPKAFREDAPTINIKKKPIITEDLFEHMIEGIDQHPKIMTRPSQSIVGLKTDIPSPFISNEDICEIVAIPWVQMFERQVEITERTKKEYYGLTTSESGNFVEDTLTYIAGVPVPENTEIPQGMISYFIPEQEVAVFQIHADIEKDIMKETIDYIYGYWLPNSKYIRADGDDYGFFEGDIDFENPNALKAKYIIPVKLKE